MTEPASTSRQGPVGYPVRTKLVIVVVVACVAAAFAVAVMAADTDTDDPVALSGDTGTSTAVAVTIAPGIEQRLPRDGAEVLAQERIELDLAAGWTGELVIQPRSGAAIPIPGDQVEQTPLDQLIFEPGDDKVLDRLPNGGVCVEATIWDRVRGRAASERVDTWCFDVT